MNYYYPYFQMPYGMASVPTRTGLRGLLGNIKWGSILSGTQKTLNVVNQAIPLVKQAKPIINNAKTMFRVMNEFKKVDISSNNVKTNKQNEQTTEQTTEQNNSKKIVENNNPVFFA